jgi:hypothetical protein
MLEHTCAQKKPVGLGTVTLPVRQKRVDFFLKQSVEVLLRPAPVRVVHKMCCPGPIRGVLVLKSAGVVLWMRIRYLYTRTRMQMLKDYSLAHNSQVFPTTVTEGSVL